VFRGCKVAYFLTPIARERVYNDCNRKYINCNNVPEFIGENYRRMMDKGYSYKIKRIK